jgi:hypothetical protein
MLAGVRWEAEQRELHMEWLLFPVFDAKKISFQFRVRRC